jgi:hypothetical protein
MRQDLTELMPQVRAAMPAPDEILVLPALDLDDRRPWLVTQMLAVPAGLEEHPVLGAEGLIALPLPVEERVYAVVLRQGLSRADLFSRGALAMSFLEAAP